MLVDAHTSVTSAVDSRGVDATGFATVVVETRSVVALGVATVVIGAGVVALLVGDSAADVVDCGFEATGLAVVVVGAAGVDSSAGFGCCLLYTSPSPRD